MKIPLLLTQFLYKNKKLSLPGIGIFTLDPTAVIPDEHNKDIHAAAVGIEFKNAPIHAADDELIEYIRVNTGKIKPLAIADLDSYLTLGTELLNIGKPFYLEGIGTLTKDREGRFIFTRGEYSVVKQEDGGLEKTDKPGKRKSVLEESHFEPQPNSARRLLLVFAIIGGLSLIGWGGYMLYKKNTAPKNETENAIIPTDSTAIKPDTTTIAVTSPADSPAANKTEVARPAPGGDSVLYKFNILETNDKAKALKRYNQLLGFQLKIRLYTRDSAFFKVYFNFPALPKDTIHIKDSLRREYGHRVTIER